MGKLENGVLTIAPAHGGAFDAEVRSGPGPGPPAANPLVLVPGVAGPRGMFHHQIEDFARDRDVVAIDLNTALAKGMGAVDSAAEDVLSTLDFLGLERVDLLGTSFGACAVARFAWRHPERVRRMVWVVPPVVQSSSWRVSFSPRLLLGGALLKLSPPRARGAVARSVSKLRLYSPEPQLCARELELVAARASRMALWPLVRRVRDVLDWDWRTLPAPHPVPALVIQGHAEHEATPSDALEAWRRLTGRPVAVIPGRHMPYLSHPSDFNSIVREFLTAA
jgi:pimeloyl-ACP methyl ester carboxylesterase